MSNLQKNTVAEVFLNLGQYSVDKPFDYRIPLDISDRIKRGSFVKVPFRNDVKIGLISRIKKGSKIANGDLRDIISLINYKPVIDKNRTKLLYWLSSYYLAPLNIAFKLFLPPFSSEEKLESLLRSPDSNLSQKESIYIDHDLYLQRKEKINWRKNKAKKRIIDYILKKGKTDKKKLLYKTRTSNASLDPMLEEGLLKSEKTRVKIDQSYMVDKRFFFDKKIKLNSEQIKAKDSVCKAIKDGIHHNFILEGVTGSGKTLVYIEIAKSLLSKNKKILIMTPEIILTPQLYSRFYDRFGDRVAFYHSNMSLAERTEVWVDTWQGRYDVIIGTRSSLFLPIEGLGCIVLDEGHDISYKESSSVRYNTFTVAEKLGRFLNIPVLYGSATPSVEMIYTAENLKGYTHLRLANKAFRSKITKDIIDLKDIDKAIVSGTISNRMHRDIASTLDKGNKVIVFINRRGYSNFLICKDCGHIPKCHSCDLSYTYHSHKKENLLCHHCNNSENFRGICEKCGSKNVSFCGAGTQKVEQELKRRFNKYPIYRMDSDSTTKRRSHTRILKRFIEKGPGILIGTQMVAKGLDLEDVTLVCVINSDRLIELPDFHMQERVFQNITQITGRTARKSKDGKVLIQTYNPDNKVIRHFLKPDNQSFFKEELKDRKELQYPPYSKIINIIISGLVEEKVKEVAMYLFTEIDKITKIGFRALGPAPAPFSKIKDHYRWHIMIKLTGDVYRFNFYLKKILKKSKGKNQIKTIIDVDPVWVL